MSNGTVPPATPDPVHQAIVAGIAGGIIVGLLRLSPAYITTVGPLLAILGVDPVKLAADVVLAIEKADAETKAQGWHWVIPKPGDPNHPDGHPYITKERT